MSKFFLIDPSGNPVSSEAIAEMEASRAKVYQAKNAIAEDINNKTLEKRDELRAIHNRVIIKVNTDAKNWHQFENGVKIRRERKYNEFNRRITEPTNGVIISGEGLPEGAEILVSHNALHDSNRIFDYGDLSGEQQLADIKYYSVPIDECFAWKDIDGTMRPIKNFGFGLRVFKPYQGRLQGIEPTIINDVIYVTTGELKGLICHTVKAADYQIVFQGENDREDCLIRFRHSDTEELDREELTCINHELTESFNQGDLLVGYEAKDAKKIKDLVPVGFNN